MKPVRHDHGREHVDIDGQRVVDAEEQRLGRQRRYDVEVRHLGERVDARVGAARAVQLEILASGDGADRAIELSGDRPRVFLNLPAAVARSGVFDGQLEARHTRF